MSYLAEIFEMCKMAQKIRIGIAQVDSNGIGYEVIIKALADSRITDLCTPIVYGCSRTFNLYKKGIREIEQINTNIINSAQDAHSKRINIINCVPDSIAVEIGQPTKDGAKCALISLEAAVKDLKEGKIDALVTAPLNKHTIKEVGFGFAGHTEYLTHEFNANDSLMLLCSERLKVGVVTNHLPLHEVCKAITEERILTKLTLMNESLIKDFNITKPKIAVLGLNPHAGDSGVLGEEELTIITPAINKATENGILAFGPYSPDGFFGTDMYEKFDAVLAMYHDQGLIPFKALSFDDGVNYTAGLPIVRTSPDHGTAYSIAGKDMANPKPMRSAIYAAIDICRNRAEYDLLRENPLEIKHFESTSSNKSFERMFEKSFDKAFSQKDSQD